MNKFNGFENWLLKQALKNHIEQLEKDVLSREEGELRERSIFAPGYFTMVAKDIETKIDNNTKYQKNEIKN